MVFTNVANWIATVYMQGKRTPAVVARFIKHLIVVEVNKTQEENKLSSLVFEAVNLENTEEEENEDADDGDHNDTDYYSASEMDDDSAPPPTDEEVGDGLEEDL